MNMTARVIVQRPALIYKIIFSWIIWLVGIFFCNCKWNYFQTKNRFFFFLKRKYFSLFTLMLLLMFSSSSFFCNKLYLQSWTFFFYNLMKISIFVKQINANYMYLKLIIHKKCQLMLWNTILFFKLNYRK